MTPTQKIESFLEVHEIDNVTISNENNSYTVKSNKSLPMLLFDYVVHTFTMTSCKIGEIKFKERHHENKN